MDQIKTGKFLAELRREQGYTQQDLADKIGVTGKTISRWENGHYMPDIDILQILSKLYAVSITELLEGERMMENMSVSKVDDMVVGAVRLDRKALRERRDAIRKDCIKKHRLWLIILLFVGIVTFTYSILTLDYEAAITTVAFFAMTFIALDSILSFHVEYEINTYLVDNLD